MKRTSNKWSTNKCGRCGEAHSNYSGKLDKDNIEYVVCGVTHKRMNVLPVSERDEIFKTEWTLNLEKTSLKY